MAAGPVRSCRSYGLGLGARAQFHISRLVGMAPFRLSRSSASRSRWWELYSLAVCVLSVGTLSLLSYWMYLGLTGLFYQDLLTILLIIKGVFACFLHIVSLARRGSILRAFNGILRYEARAARAAGRRRPAAVDTLVVAAENITLVTVFVWTATLTWPVLSVLPVSSQVCCLLSSYLPVVIICTSDLQFGNLALLINRQLSKLSHSARHLQLQLREATAGGPQLQLVDAMGAARATATSLADKTRSLRVRQESIYTCVSDLNSAFAIQLLMAVMLGLMEAVCGLYFIITNERASWRPLLIAWNVIHITKLAMIMTPCQWVETKGDVIADCISVTLVMQDLPKEVHDELKEFQMQMAHLKMRFTAAGVFPLDYSQLQKVMSTIATYFVILLQMQGRSDRPSQPN